jgi:hypothetical protein
MASSKAFTCQLAVLACLAIAAGRVRGVLSPEDERALVRALIEVPRLTTEALTLEPQIEPLAIDLAKIHNVLYLGRGTSFPLALGALQLKEISYIHAEGYAAGDLKNCGRQICQVVQRQIPRARDNELVHNLLDWLPKWTTMVERRRQEGVTQKVFTGSGQSHPRRVKPQRDFE